MGTLGRSIVALPKLSFREDRRMPTRRRFKQTRTLQDRLAEWANQVLEQAARLPPGPERDAILKKLRLADTAAHLDACVNVPGSQPSE